MQHITSASDVPFRFYQEYYVPNVTSPLAALEVIPFTCQFSTCSICYLRHDRVSNRLVGVGLPELHNGAPKLELLEAVGTTATNVLRGAHVVARLLGQKASDLTLCPRGGRQNPAANFGSHKVIPGAAIYLRVYLETSTIVSNN